MVLKAIKLSTLLLICIITGYFIIAYRDGLLSQISQVVLLTLLIQFVSIWVIFLNFIFTHIESANVKHITVSNNLGSKIVHLKMWNLGKCLALFNSHDSNSIETFRGQRDNDTAEEDMQLIEIPPQSALELKVVLKDAQLNAKKIKLYYLDNIGKRSFSIKR